MVLDTNYTDHLTIDGIYYYVIVAGDNYVNCSISNCVSVTVEFPTENEGIPGFKLFFTIIGLIAISTIYLLNEKKRYEIYLGK